MKSLNLLIISKGLFDMLKRFISKKILAIYFLFVGITWLEAIINPTVVSMIVTSFEDRNLHSLWEALVIGMIGNLILLVGLSGKRFYYAKLIADFNLKIKREIFHRFLYSGTIKQEEVLSNLENDVEQLEDLYIEPFVIIISSAGFTTVSILFALIQNFWLGILFVVFYSIPALCSGIGSKKLSSISYQKSRVNKTYTTRLTNIIGGQKVIQHYRVQNFFFERFSKHLDANIAQNIHYEKQRTINTILIKGIDVFCSITPIVIGGLMAYYGFLTGASFIAIYLVSYNIGYQFQELSYYINTLKSSQDLREKYDQIFLLPEKEKSTSSKEDIFPLQFQNVSLQLGGKTILSQLSLHIEAGEKVAIIGKSGCGKSTLLNLIAGELTPDSGRILFNGKPLKKEQILQKTAYILQDSYCFDDLSLEENIALGKTINQDSMQTILEKVNLLPLQHQTLNPNELSGGEKQRIEIARALYADNNLILADEIRSNLDKENSQKMEDILFDIPQTVIEVIHHYTDDSLKKYDQVIDLSALPKNLPLI